MKIKRYVEIPLDYEQAQTVRNLWSTYGEPQAVTFGQVINIGLHESFRLRIFTPKQAKKMQRLLTSFKLRK